MKTYRLENGVHLRKQNAFNAPCYLLLGGHKSKLNSEAIEILYQNNVREIVFPSHKLQPFDVYMHQPIRGININGMEITTWQKWLEIACHYYNYQLVAIPVPNKEEIMQDLFEGKEHILAKLPPCYYFGLENWRNVALLVGNYKTAALCSQKWSRTLHPRIFIENWSS